MMHRRLLSSTATAVAVKFGATGLRLLVLLLLGVQLERSAFAQLSLAFSLAELARYALDFGSDAWMQRESGRRHPRAAARLAGRVMGLRLLQAGCVIVLGLALVLVLTDIGLALCLVLMLGSATQANLVFLLHRHQSVNAAGRQGRWLLLLFALAAPAALGAAWSGHAFGSFFILLLAEAVGVAGLAHRARADGVLGAVGGWTRRSWRARIGLLTRTQAFAWIALFGLVYGRLDLWLLHLSGVRPEALAQYSLAFRTLELPWILAAGVLSSLGAQLAARRKAEGPAAAQHSTLARLLALGAAAMGGYALLAMAGLRWLDRDLPPALVAAMALLFTVKLANIAVYAQLAAGGLERRSVSITLAACGLQAGLGALAVFWLGLWGIVLSTHLVEWALLALQWRALRAAASASTSRAVANPLS